MRTLQLFLAASMAANGLACSRSESDANARRAADEVRVAAARAGDQLADSWLTTKIQAQYFADDDIKARHINVSTRDGVVTLTGYVDSQAQRNLAVEIAKITDGVRQVHDRLAVAGAPREPRAIATSGESPASGPAPAPEPAAVDAEITARVHSRFFVDDQIKGTRIDVDTRQGIVTLSGEMPSQEARNQALLLARTTEGVQRVEDHMTVAAYVPPPPPASSPGEAEPAAPAPAAAPPVDDASITTTIQAKYFVDTTVKGSAVDVSSRDGVVLLQGTVAREAVRRQAIAIARNTPGVVQVVDRLQVKR